MKKETSCEKHVEHGMPKNQGHRSELDSIWDNIEDGMTSKEILHEHGGKALKCINMIIRGLESQHDCIAIDKIILLNRSLEKCPEVEGNTEPPLGDIVGNIELEFEKHYHVRDELKDLKKINKKTV